jgi:hypothetical protein
MAINIRVYPNYSPRIIEILAPITDVTVQELVNAIRAWEDSEIGELYPFLLEADGKQALTGDVAVGITATLQDAKVMFSGRTTPLIHDDSVTSDNTLGTRLIASGGNFITNGVVPGSTIINETTHGMTSVVEVISESELLCLAPTGGSRVSWLTGDVYSILPNVECSITGGNLVAIDDLGTEISPIFPSPGVQMTKADSSSATLVSTAETIVPVPVETVVTRTIERSPKIRVKASETAETVSVPAETEVEPDSTQRTSEGSTTQVIRNSSSRIGP